MERSQGHSMHSSVSYVMHIIFHALHTHTTSLAHTHTKHTHTHTCTHTHTHTQTHTRTRTHRSRSSSINKLSGVRRPRTLMVQLRCISRYARLMSAPMCFSVSLSVNFTVLAGFRLMCIKECTFEFDVCSNVILSEP